MVQVESVFAGQPVQVGLLALALRFVAVAELLQLQLQMLPLVEVAKESNVKTTFEGGKKTYTGCGGSRLQPRVTLQHCLTCKFIMATSCKELLLLPRLLLILHAAEFSWCKFRHLLILAMCIMYIGRLSLIHWRVCADGWVGDKLKNRNETHWKLFVLLRASSRLYASSHT